MTPEEQLAAIRTATDPLAIDGDGRLTVEASAVADLLKQFGSPLYIVSEAALRANFRRIRQAFAACWPGAFDVLYAIKANNNPAIRAILHAEGAGGDCFGLGELHATLLGGADPDIVVMNGSNKTMEELRAAIGRGITINIDEPSEIDDVRAIAGELGRRARVNLRLKVLPEAFQHRASDYFGVGADVGGYLAQWKWGLSPSAARPLIEALAGDPRIDLAGYSAHTGRVTNEPAAFGEYTGELARTIVQLAQATGFKPRLLDIGGGWPRARDPESRGHGVAGHAIEAFARSATAGLIAPLQAAGLPLPRLWIEPGRFIVGNAVVLAGTVGRIKRDLGLVWVNVDISTNNLLRVDTSGSAYHLLAATGMRRRCTEPAIVVGPTCAEAKLAEGWPMPDGLVPGEPLAVLDAGMYAETTANQFNGMPRPATVLVSGSEAELIKARETVEDVFAKCRIPDRLRAATAAAARA